MPEFSSELGPDLDPPLITELSIFRRATKLVVNVNASSLEVDICDALSLAKVPGVIVDPRVKLAS